MPPWPAARRSCRSAGRLSGVRACGAGVSRRSASCSTSWRVPIPNEHTDRLARKAREHGIYIQSGSMIEVDPRWPDVVFNTTCLIGPEGLLYRYRKVNPWIPYEVHASPHDIEGYRRSAVSGRRYADRPDRLRHLLRLAVSRSDAPAGRQRRRSAGARLRLHGSLGRDRADELVDDRQSLPRAREHRRSSSRRIRAPACGTIRRTPGRAAARSSTSTAGMLADASPGPGERIVVAPIDITALRHERATRRGHHMLAHLRTEAYPVYASGPLPADAADRGPCRGTVI